MLTRRTTAVAVKKLSNAEEGKVWATLGVVEGCFTKETNSSCILREGLTKKRWGRTSGQRAHMRKGAGV